jgi:hypothetical protein
MSRKTFDKLLRQVMTKPLIKYAEIQSVVHAISRAGSLGQITGDEQDALRGQLNVNVRRQIPEVTEILHARRKK